MSGPMRIGTAPISWGVCELPDWGLVLPYERVLDEMAELGYTGTELGPWGYLPRDPSALRRALDARHLELAGAFCPVTLHDPARYDEQVRYALETSRLLADLAAEPPSLSQGAVVAGPDRPRSPAPPSTPVHAPVLVLAEAGDPSRARIAGRVAPEDARFSADDWARFAEGANEIARRARALGLVTAFHPHAGTYVETPGEIDQLLRCTDPDLVGLCLDTGHVAYGGGDPVALARRDPQRVRHVHLKDVDRERYERALAQRLDFTAAVGEDVFAPVGQGSLDMKGVLRTLREAGYDGWLIVEQDIRIREGHPHEPKADGATSYAFITAQLA